MPRLHIDVAGKPLLDIDSYARRGPGQRDRLSPAEIALITRTVTWTPEVMVKVLTRGGQDLGAVRRHLAYLNRGGELELETDQGERLLGRGVEQNLLDDWDLDLEECRRRASLGPRADRRPPKLVHKVLFSMPPGTPPKKVLEAAKNFAREEFALKYRYALVLHTDEPHPHVHMVVKAVSEQGGRLNIRKGTLREWRGEFARLLRELGVAANATERAVRGVVRTHQKDGIYRAAARGDSTHFRARLESVANELQKGHFRVELETSKLIQTRKKVERGWRTVSDILVTEGQSEVAADVRRFLTQMPTPHSERERIAAAVLQRVGTEGDDRHSPIR